MDEPGSPPVSLLADCRPGVESWESHACHAVGGGAPPPSPHGGPEGPDRPRVFFGRWDEVPG